MKKVSLSLVVALNMLTSLYAENNATASTPEDLGTIEVQDTQKLRRDDRDYEARKLVKSTTRLDLTARETPQSLTVVTEATLNGDNRLSGADAKYRGHYERAYG